MFPLFCNRHSPKEGAAIAQHGHALIEFNTHPDLRGVRSVQGTNVTHTFTRHIHSACCISLLLNGTRGCARPCYTGTVTAGSVEVINPGEPHEIYPIDGLPYSYRTVCVELDKYYTNYPVFIREPVKDRDLFQRLKQAFNLLNAPVSLLEKENEILLVLELLTSEYTVATLPIRRQKIKNTIQEVKGYMENNYSRNVSIQELAATSRLSPYHLSREFREYTGLPPHEYLTNYRVRLARRMMEDGEGIAETAAATGFVDQSHFTRCFKRIMGITPGLYLKCFNKNSVEVQESMAGVCPLELERRRLLRRRGL